MACVDKPLIAKENKSGKVQDERSVVVPCYLHQQKCMLLENACHSLRCLNKHLKEPQAKSKGSKMVLFCAFQCFKKVKSCTT